MELLENFGGDGVGGFSIDREIAGPELGAVGDLKEAEMEDGGAGSRRGVGGGRGGGLIGAAEEEGLVAGGAGLGERGGFSRRRIGGGEAEFRAESDGGAAEEGVENGSDGGGGIGGGGGEGDDREPVGGGRAGRGEAANEIGAEPGEIRAEGAWVFLGGAGEFVGDGVELFLGLGGLGRAGGSRGGRDGFFAEGDGGRAPRGLIGIGVVGIFWGAAVAGADEAEDDPADEEGAAPAWQAAYYRGQEAKAAPLAHRLKLGFWWATWAAIFCTLGYSVAATLHLEVAHEVERIFFLLLPICLPVVAAGCMSFVSINDLQRRVARYRDMQALLERCRRQMVVSHSWHAVTKVVAATEEGLLQELLEWHAISRYAETH